MSYLDFGFDCFTLTKPAVAAALQDLGLTIDNKAKKADLVRQLEYHCAMLREDEGTNPTDYLQANFKPNSRKFTKAKIRHVLLLHKVAFYISDNKAQLVTTLNKALPAIKARMHRPKGKGHRGASKKRATIIDGTDDVSSTHTSAEHSLDSGSASPVASGALPGKKVKHGSIRSIHHIVRFLEDTFVDVFEAVENDESEHGIELLELTVNYLRVQMAFRSKSTD